MAGESLTSNARRALPIRNRFTKPSKEKPFSVGIASSPSGNPQRAGRPKRVRCGQHPCDWAVRDLQAEDRGVAQTLTLIGLAPRIGGDGQTLTSESERAPAILTKQGFRMAWVGRLSVRPGGRQAARQQNKRCLFRETNPGWPSPKDGRQYLWEGVPVSA